MSEYGIDSESQSYRELIAGGVQTLPVTVKANEGALAVGQVLEWDASAHAFKKFVSGASAAAYAVVAEAVTIGASAAKAVAIVCGPVNFAKLDATAKADADIVGALLGSGIIPVNQAA